MAILEVRNIEKHFGRTNVLKDVSFSMEEGNALAIIGSSGSGKTTLLRCLNFLERPDSGQIIVNGETLFDASEAGKDKDAELRKKRLHFGMVFQQFNLFPQYTALENVTLAERLLAQETPEFKKDKKAILARIDEHGKELLDRMGLAERMNHYPHQLSGGQQQRVAIARALALKPDILCFDEPTSALDPELTGEVLKVIRSLAQQNTTMKKKKKTIFQPTVDINATVKAGPITGPKKEPFNKNELALPFSFLLNHLKIAIAKAG